MTTSDTRTILRVFLASPGDMQEERKTVRNAVAEVNELVAEEFGVHVELLGWEETLIGAGRPQALINQELDRCGLVIAMMWRRWGTPP